MVNGNKMDLVGVRRLLRGGIVKWVLRRVGFRLFLGVFLFMGFVVGV